MFTCNFHIHTMYFCGLENYQFMILQVVGGKMTELGRLGAFITKVKKGSLADVVGHLRAGKSISYVQNILSFDFL